MNIKSEDARHIINSLKMGFRTDCHSLDEMERDLVLILESARQFGMTHGAAAGWDSGWDQKWVAISGILRRIRKLVNDMDCGTQTSEGSLLDRALVAFGCGSQIRRRFWAADQKIGNA